jgi:hypothetical protein
MVARQQPPGSATGGKTPKIGDIVEIATPAGFGYVQYTHDSQSMGTLVRVLPGLYSSRPADFRELSRQRELYFTFFTLKYALRDGKVEIVCNQSVPVWAKENPLMRSVWVKDPKGNEHSWRLMRACDEPTPDSHARTPVLHTLTPEQKRLSIRSLWPFPVMVNKLARGWTPERDDELSAQDRSAAARKPESTFKGEWMRCYLYFPDESSARAAGERLGLAGFTVEVRLGAGGEKWLALASIPSPDTEAATEKLRDDLEALARELGGECSGFDLAV